ncbi:hypothetical protein KL930_004210 [Ogataea haglerorum]|uniref:Cytochrome b5 heme-binding domain-containing protein n=1 Tax=Ogataea haglerorum TaxID=1937702 RepID=A0AAN6D3D3_9ASCO|nr:hypothetical protein KL915_004320 [Ogataea haglerorum]KAG7704190.1 hypothetical protein KL914_004177 [Ogataea haglerorum]KAG7704375.1 hypothetical protein KL950_004182 [Ogataea haglerorum]KAG7725447.1 hypothetical protein KL933_004013 [Ogataea haglerorum]KAG7728235.1 hypothetical protein KL948_004102 [Ogataea haglerorum]
MSTGSRRVFTAEEVATHVSADDLWMVINGKVYDVTSLIEQHPGGSEVLFDCAGVDATIPFYDVSHSENAFEMLSPCFKGYLKRDSSIELGLTTKRKSDKYYRSLQEIREAQRQPLQDTQAQGNKSFILILSLMAFSGLGMFIYLQRKKWSEWI